MAVPAGSGVAHCRVAGIIGTEIKFSLLMPNAWNGKFLMGGGGGFVGSVQNQAQMVVNAGYATAGTDTGHTGGTTDATWALNNIERQVNYGYLDPRECKVDVTTLTGVSAAQAAALKTIYAPTRAGGETVSHGQPFGGEGEAAGWPGWISGAAPRPGQTTGQPARYAFGTQFFKYLVFNDPDWDSGPTTCRRGRRTRRRPRRS